MSAFTNKVAVITGGNSGIGLATAKEVTHGVRNRTIVVLVAWFLFALGGSLLGVFDSGPRPPVLLGLAFVVPVAAFVACLVLVLLSIALAFGLIALGIWAWAAFLIVSAAYVLFAALILGIAYLKLRRLSGLKMTRETVSESLGILGGDSQQPDGQQPEITARKTG